MTIHRVDIHKTSPSHRHHLEDHIVHPQLPHLLLELLPSVVLLSDLLHEPLHLPGLHHRHSTPTPPCPCELTSHGSLRSGQSRKLIKMVGTRPVVDPARLVALVHECAHERSCVTRRVPFIWSERWLLQMWQYFWTRAASEKTCLQVLQGSQVWSTSRTLYDFGISFRSTSNGPNWSSRAYLVKGVFSRNSSITISMFSSESFKYSCRLPRVFNWQDSSFGIPNFVAISCMAMQHSQTLLLNLVPTARTLLDSSSESMTTKRQDSGSTTVVLRMGLNSMNKDESLQPRIEMDWSMPPQAVPTNLQYLMTWLMKSTLGLRLWVLQALAVKRAAQTHSEEELESPAPRGTFPEISTFIP